MAHTPMEHSLGTTKGRPTPQDTQTRKGHAMVQATLLPPTSPSGMVAKTSSNHTPWYGEKAQPTNQLNNSHGIVAGGSGTEPLALKKANIF